MARERERERGGKCGRAIKEEANAIRTAHLRGEVDG